MGILLANGYIPATGIWELDAIIYAGAVVTALAVIWRKVLRPIVSAAKKVNAALDLSENLTPSVQAALLALPGQMKAVHERIDDHMLREEASQGAMQADMAAIKAALDERTPLFDEMRETLTASNRVLTKHMASDEERFEAAAEALVKGQAALNANLETIKQSLPKGTS